MCIVEAYTPKDVAFPTSIQNLKDKIGNKKNAKIAEVAEYKREKENVQLDTIPEERRPKISKKRMKDVQDIIVCFSPSPHTPLDQFNVHVSSPVVPDSASWKSSPFDSNVDFRELFHKNEKS